jgi:hypothetical protein
MRTDWKTRAREARARLRDAKHGERESVLRSIAGTNDVNTVRREIFVLEFVDLLKRADPELAKALKDAPLSAMETLARWSSFDKAAAMKAAKDLSRGYYTGKSLTSAMRSARPTDVSTYTGESLGTAYRMENKEPAVQAVRRLLGKLSGRKLSGPKVNYKEGDDPPIDYHFLLLPEPGGGTVQSVAAIIVGPYQNRTLYRKRRHEWLLRALGLSWLYDHVVLLLPAHADAADYTKWIEKARIRAAKTNISSDLPEGRSRLPNVYAVHPDFPPLHPDAEAAINRLGSS